MTDSEIRRLISESERRLARQINVLRLVILGMALSLAHSLYVTRISWGEFIIGSDRAPVRSLQRQNRVLGERLRIIEQRLEIDRDAKRGEL